MSYIRERLYLFELNPPRVLALGFLGLILFGSVLLNLPVASADGNSIGFLDALFTSASAVCVTGLIVVNTATYWSVFGKVVILFLIQIGGLGIMTMATMVALIMGKKISLKERLIIKEQMNQETMSGMVKLTLYVILLTFAIEAIGAIILSFRFVPEYGLTKGIWFSVFHSISAFCNAGFDITGNSLMSYTDSPLTIMTLSGLIIIGGTGFSVLIDLAKHRRWVRLSLHTKLVITMSLGLILLGTIFFFVLEYSNPATIGQMPLGEKLSAAFFAAVVPRTAGFNSIDTAALRESSVFLTIILMFVGGSPGSTAGGVKTATIGVVLMATISIIRGDKDIEIYEKRLNQETVFKSLAIVTVGMGMIVLISFLLTITESKNFLDVLFEATSAFATVGLSRGITSDLTTIGKIIIIGTMYAGRVGPLTMAYAIGYNKKHKRYRYSEGHISVG
ncbi:MAG TPA: TrkH family potassium uptake protein [Tissierellaceae bacterium]|jgi:trk system potassium uptake protein TrkH|nr:TrkH family potassium uptake protein [Tissierellaceae bacterium]